MGRKIEPKGAGSLAQEYRKLLEEELQARVANGTADSREPPHYAQQLAMQRYAAERANTALGNLLARIHRDGGHYQAQHGLEKALADAHNVVASLLAESDERSGAVDDCPHDSSEAVCCSVCHAKALRERDEALGLLREIVDAGAIRFVFLDYERRAVSLLEAANPGRMPPVQDEVLSPKE
mgnify:CR=1 FL=1